jgi:hypothetical protein
MVASASARHDRFQLSTPHIRVRSREGLLKPRKRSQEHETYHFVDNVGAEPHLGGEQRFCRLLLKLQALGQQLSFRYFNLAESDVRPVSGLHPLVPSMW